MTLTCIAEYFLEFVVISQLAIQNGEPLLEVKYDDNEQGVELLKVILKILQHCTIGLRVQNKCDILL